jgi:phosphate transport system permease protein
MPIYRSDKSMITCSFFVLFFSVGSLLFLLIFITSEAFPVLTNVANLGQFLFFNDWVPLGDSPSFGVLHSWVSTLLMTAICMFFAIPIGVGIGIFISEIAPDWMQRILQPCIEALEGIPAVVYGFIGYVTLVPWIENIFDLPTGETLLAAGLILALMVLPYIASVSAESLQQVPKEMRHAVYAQGVTQFYAIRKVILPLAAPGVFAGISLGFARAIGETLAVTMLAGNVVATPMTPFDRGQPLTSLIATELGEAGVGSEMYHSLFAAGAVLMLIVIVINLLALKFRRRQYFDELSF